MSLTSQRGWQLWTTACLILLAGPFVSVSRGQTDPVENLRKIFALTKQPDDVDFLKRRNELLKKAAGELQTIQHLRRAYFLASWPSNDDPEAVVKKEEPNPIQVEIGDRLVAAIKKAKDQASAGRADTDDAVRKAAQVKLLAVAMLLAELADSEPLTDRKREKFARRLTDVAVELCADANVAVKQTALHALGKMTPPPAKAMQVLRPRVQNASEPGPRKVAAYALIDLVKNGPALSREELAQTIQGVLETAKVGLDDTSAEEMVRGYCLLAMRDAAKALDDWAQSPTFAEKESAADAQKALAACEAASVSLSKTLDDSSVNLRVAAIDTFIQFAHLRARLLPRLGGKAGLPDPLGRTAFEDRIHEMAAVLVKKDSDVRERRGASTFLDLLGVECSPALPEITQAMSDKDGLVRYTAARTIRHFTSEANKKTSRLKTETIEALGKLLLDGDPDIASSAGASLEVLGPHAAAAIESLSRAITFGDTENRVVVIKMVGNLGTANALRAYPAVIAALVHDDSRVTRQAAETLGAFGAIAKKEDAATDPALRNLIASFRAAALPALAKALRDGDAETRLNASEAILTIGPAPKGL